MVAGSYRTARPTFTARMRSELALCVRTPLPTCLRVLHQRRCATCTQNQLKVRGAGIKAQTKEQRGEGPGCRRSWHGAPQQAPTNRDSKEVSAVRRYHVYVS